MSKKITNKRLFYNFKTKKAPLQILPLTSFNFKRMILKKPKYTTVIQSRCPALHCSLEKLRTVKTKRKRQKMSYSMTIRAIKRFSVNLGPLHAIGLLIGLYLVAGTAVLLFPDGAEFIKNIVLYSIIGFFTFFMGYLGYILARDVIQVLLSKLNLLTTTEIEA